VTAGPAEGDSALLRRILPVLIIMSMIGPITLNILMPSMPGLVRALEAEREQVQFVLSAFLAAQAVGQLFVGGLADRYGRRPVLRGGFALYVAASLAAILATGIGWLVMARIMQAMGAIAGLTLARTIVRDLAPRDQAASMIGYVVAGMVVGPLIAPGLGGIVDDAFGWRAIFVLCAIVGVIALALGWMKLPETRPAAIVGQTTPEMLRRSLDVCRDRRFLGYAVSASLTSGVFFAFLGAAPYLVVDVLQLPKFTYALWFTSLTAGYFIGNFSSGKLSVRLGTERMIFLGNVLGMAGAVVMLALALGGTLTPAALFLPSFVISLGNGLLLPNAVAASVSVDPKAAGAAAGTVGFLQMALGGIVSYVAGQVTGQTMLPLALMMFAMTAGAWWAVRWTR
jgi:DHA1 family bicyclomycin/chloramphenicol resistance-like MFS transporter